MKDPTLYVPVHAGLFVHRKLDRVATRLGVSGVVAVGHLVSLWTSVLQQTSDGILRRWDGVDVARAARWTGKPDEFHDALVAEEWLEHSQEGDIDAAGEPIPLHTLMVRGWEDYAGAGMKYRETEKKRKAVARAAKRGGQVPPVPPLSADNPHLSADVPRQRNETKLTETKRNETELERESAAAPPEPPPSAVIEPSPSPIVKTVQPTMSVGTPRHRAGMNRSSVAELEDAPQTVREFLARSSAYPHHVAKNGEESFGDLLRKDLGGTFDGQAGRLTLERAIEIGPWAHWQSADQREDRPRWIWPSQAPSRIERWVRDDANKAAGALLSQKRAEAQGIDLTKPTTKVDPVRHELVKAYNRRMGQREDLPPLQTWIDDVVSQGRADDEIARLSPTAQTPPSTPPPTPEERAQSKIAYDKFCSTVPPQDRARGLPSWRQWWDGGQPVRWTGALGSGGPPRTPPSSTAVNQPPMGDDVDDDEATIAAAKAKLEQLAGGGKLGGLMARALLEEASRQ